MHLIQEHRITDTDGGAVQVRPLADNPDGTTEVEIRDCGVLVRAGQRHTVPTDAIYRH